MPNKNSSFVDVRSAAGGRIQKKSWCTHYSIEVLYTTVKDRNQLEHILEQVLVARGNRELLFLFL